MSKPIIVKPFISIKSEKELNLTGESFIKIMKAVLQKECSFRFRAKGCSMHPFIKDGDMVTITLLKNKNPRCGDIVAFVCSQSQKLNIHRIVDIWKGRFHIKGDNACKTDGLIPSENIIGFVTRVERADKMLSFGFGPEKFLIAKLSRLNLFPKFYSLWRFIISVFWR